MLAVRVPAQQVPCLRVARTDDSIIVLSDSSRWQPGLYDIRYLAVVSVPGGLPAFVFAAYNCNECDAGPDVWILRAHDSASAAAATNYPGTHHELGQDRPYDEGAHGSDDLGQVFLLVGLGLGLVTVALQVLEEAEGGGGEEHSC